MPSRKIHIIHWSVLLASLILTMVVWFYSMGKERDANILRFERESERIVSLVRERMKHYEDALGSGVATLSALGKIPSRPFWKTYVENMSLEIKYPGINGMGLILEVDPVRKEEFEKNRQMEFPGFAIKPSHDNPHLLPIVYCEPIGTNREAIGLDMAHETNRYEAFLDARSTRRPQITGPVVLVQDDGKTPGFLFFSPLFAGRKNDFTGYSNNEFVGMVYAPFVFWKLIAGTLAAERRNVVIRVSDGDSVLYDEMDLSVDNYDPNSDFDVLKNLSLYGREWVFEVSAGRSFLQDSQAQLPLIILVAGIVIDALLLSIMFAFAKGRERAELLARKMSEVAQHQRQAAVQASRLATLGETAAGIAHEINNPLSLIQAHIEKLRILTDANKLDPTVIRETTASCSLTIKRINGIVKGLKNLSRDGDLDPLRQECIVEVVQDALDLCQAGLYRLNIRLDLELIPEAKGLCRRVNLSQVIVNLINNARDAVEGTTAPWVKVEMLWSGDFLEVKVSNSGTKIDREIAEKMFTPFFTTKAIGKGTGLGLSLSRKMMESQGGTLFLESDAADTTFVVRIPSVRSS